MLAQYAGMKFKTEGRSIQGHRVFVVEKLHFGAWVDWVYISQSTIAGVGRGIFAARNFEDGEYIGRYLGRLLGLRAEFTDAVLKVKPPQQTRFLNQLVCLCIRKLPQGKQVQAPALEQDKGICCWNWCNTSLVQSCVEWQVAIMLFANMPWIQLSPKPMVSASGIPEPIPAHCQRPWTSWARHCH